MAKIHRCSYGIKMGLSDAYIIMEKSYDTSDTYPLEIINITENPQSNINFCRQTKAEKEDWKTIRVCGPYIKGMLEKDSKDLGSIQYQDNIQKQLNFM